MHRVKMTIIYQRSYTTLYIRNFHSGHHQTFKQSYNSPKSPKLQPINSSSHCKVYTKCFLFSQNFPTLEEENTHAQI